MGDPKFPSFIKPANLRRMDRIGKVMVSAVRMALYDSGLDLGKEDLPIEWGFQLEQALEARIRWISSSGLF